MTPEESFGLIVRMVGAAGVLGLLLSAVLVAFFGVLSGVVHDNPSGSYASR